MAAKPEPGPPLYQRIKDWVARQIEAERWPPHHRVPSENELVRELGASRMTVNRALGELSREGVLYRVQGLGTFVAERKPHLDLLEIRNIAEEIRARGHRHSSRVHLLRAERATKDVARELEVRAGTRVFHSLIVHAENGLPVQLEDRWVNPAVAPGYLDVDLERVTANEYLTRVAPIRAAHHSVEAVLPDERARRLLGVGAREPCLLVHRWTWSGRSVASHARLLHPGTRFRLEARLERDRARS